MSEPSISDTILLDSRTIRYRESEKLTPRQIGNACMGSLSAISMLAVLIIGSLSVAGVLPGATAGWCALGLGAGALGVSLWQAWEGDRKAIYLVLATAAITIVGALGGAGVLSASQVGWGMVGSVLTSGFLGCCVFCCGAALETMEDIDREIDAETARRDQLLRNRVPFDFGG